MGFIKKHLDSLIESYALVAVLFIIQIVEVAMIVWQIVFREDWATTPPKNATLLFVRCVDFLAFAKKRVLLSVARVTIVRK